MSPAAQSDEDLIALYYGCDDLAFAELKTRYERRLFAYFKRRIHNYDVAEDLVQETFLRIARTKVYPGGRFRRTGTNRFVSWLFGIAYHCLQQHLREATRRGRVPTKGGGAVEQAPDHSASPVEQHDVQRALSYCLGKLKPEQREVIELDLQSLERKEVAAILGITYEQAAALRHAAWNQLRICLAQEGF